MLDFEKVFEENRQFILRYLIKLCKNTYFAYLGDSKKTLPLEEQQISESTPDIATLFAEKELSDKAFSCLHALEEPYKEVFMLCAFGCLSLKDISALFGKSESWARVTFYRAKQKLMEGMGKYDQL